MTLQVADGYSAADIWVAGKTYRIDSQTAASLTTDAVGKVSVAILTSAGLAAPALVLGAAGLDEPLTVQPAGSLHTYLSGQGTLNPTNPGGPLPVFDAAGTTLQGAEVKGQPLASAVKGNTALAGTAAQAIRNAAATAVGQPPTGIAGYHASLADRDRPTFTAFKTRGDFEARLATLRGSAGLLGSFWGDVDQWAGDVWEGIKNGVIEIQDFAVDVASKVATLTLKLGNMVAHSVRLTLHTLEQAAHFIAGVFQAIYADIQLVIEWLMALFDFAAIWRTMRAFKETLLAVPPYIRGLGVVAREHATGAIAEAQSKIDGGFDALIAHYAQQTFASQPHWIAPGGAATNRTPIAGHASPADFTNNVHHNWLQDKFVAYAPAGTPIGASSANSPDPWNAFVSSLAGMSSDLTTAAVDFMNAARAIVLVRGGGRPGSRGRRDKRAHHGPRRGRGRQGVSQQSGARQSGGAWSAHLHRRTQSRPTDLEEEGRRARRRVCQSAAHPRRARLACCDGGATT